MDSVENAGRSEPPAEAIPEEDGDATETDRPAGEQADETEDDARAIRAAQYVYTTINGNVLANSAAFGISGGGVTGKRATGPISAVEVDTALRCYLEPDGLAEAREVLLDKHLVILSGTEGSGKRAAALKLLSELPGSASGRSLVSVSPAASFSELVQHATFKADHGYLVRNHVRDGSETPVRSYDAMLLSTKLQRSRAYLVITSTSASLSPRHLPELSVRVVPPNPANLLDHCLGDTVADQALLEQARAYVAGLRRPREVTALADRLVTNPAEAAAAIRGTARDQVTKWADGKVTKKDLFTVALLALLGNQPEPLFDRLVAMVLQQSIPLGEERMAAPHVAPHQEIMHRRDRDHELITVAAAADELWAGSGRKVRLRTPEHRLIVLEELHERFDHQLWDPLHRWLADLKALDLPTETQGELAFALAHLARVDLADVYRSFLDPWADGRANERWVAAMTLWFMGDDDRLAAAALQMAMAWGHNRGTYRAMTSAVALGGPLGLRFPGESMRRLCFLALRAKQIAAVARISLAFLFANAAENGSEATGEVLTTVTAELCRATGKTKDVGEPPTGDSFVDEFHRRAPADRGDEPEYEYGWNIRVARAARQMVVAVLAAPQMARDDPVTALVLRTQPEHAGLLGGLWADVLCSAPHRTEAIAALAATLRALEHDESALPAVHSLGTAIHAEMPERHRRLRVAELRRAMVGARTTQKPPQVLVSTLLTALSGQPVPA